MPQPHLALTIGDPAGIGSEIVLKALADPEITSQCRITVIGNYTLLKSNYEHLRGLGVNDLANPAQLDILDLPLETNQIQPGKGNAASGAASFAYLDEAITLTLKGECQGIVTAPIAKSCWQKAGYNYPGQTEVLAQRAGVDKFGMLFVARSPYTSWTMRTLLATTHIPLKAVPEALNPQLMSWKLKLLVDCLKHDFGLDAPKIAIAGLNPHSGEEGKLGTEEQDWLLPWLEQERQNYPQVKLTGLVPPDTLWVKPGQAWFKEESTDKVADGYLALYHDQGLIPVKLLAFDQAINTTIGLPFIRTSPDHGTAFDIAGQGIASALSLKAAIGLAVDLVSNKRSSVVQ